MIRIAGYTSANKATHTTNLRPVKLAHIKHPSELVYSADCANTTDGLGVDDGYRGIRYEIGTKIGMYQRHSGNINVLLADYHVEQLTPAKATEWCKVTTSLHFRNL